MDPTHVEWLHGRFSNYVLERLGRDDLKREFFRVGEGASGAEGQVTGSFDHEKIGFDEFEHGIIKRRVLAGRTEEQRYMVEGNLVLFLNRLSGRLRIGSEPDMQRVGVVHWNPVLEVAAYPKDIRE